MTTIESRTTAPLKAISPTATGAEIKAILDEDGGVIVEGFLTPEQVAALNAEIDPHLAQVRTGSTLDDPFIQDFHGRNTKRMTNMMTISPTFREVIIDMDLLHDVAEAVFREASGDYWMTTAQVIDIGPDSPARCCTVTSRTTRCSSRWDRRGRPSSSTS